MEKKENWRDGERRTEVEKLKEREKIGSERMRKKKKKEKERENLIYIKLDILKDEKS